MSFLKHEVVKLGSGLTLIKVPMKLKSVTILNLVRAGSRDENEDQYGGAHFLEHFVFKGTKKYPKVNQIARVMDGVGGKYNAFTGQDYTGFWVKVPSEHLETGLEVVGQIVGEPLLPEKELVKEKGAIIEELKMYEDNHPVKSMEELEKMVFKSSPLGRPIIGFEESIRKMRVADLKAFRGRWYTTDNMAVVVVGDWSSGKNLQKLIEENFGSIKKKKQEKKREGYGTEFKQEKPLVVVTNKETEQVHLSLGMLG